VICYRSIFVTPQLKAVESDEENTGPIEEMLLKGINAVI